MAVSFTLILKHGRRYHMVLNGAGTKMKHKNSHSFFVLLFILSSSMFISLHVEKVTAVPYWLREGSYAEYIIGHTIFNNGTVLGGFVYGWKCMEKTPEYALLEVYLKRQDGKIVMSTQVQVDLASKNLIDPESREAWGKCLFWIDPWDIGVGNVPILFNWAGRTLYANISLPPSQGVLPAGFEWFKTPFRDFEETQVCGMGFVQLPYPPESNIVGYFLFSLRYDFKSGLAVGGFYLDDILHNRFDVLCISGGPSYNGTSYKYPMVLLDTNIFDIKENPDSLPLILTGALATCVAASALVLVWRKKRRG